MSKLITVNGIIISTSAYKNNTFKYLIKDDKGSTFDYIYYANGGKNQEGLDNSRHITIKYEMTHNKYGSSKIIKEITYGKYVTDEKIIADFLVNKIKMTKSFAMKLTKKYGENTLDIVFNNTDKLSEIANNNLSDILSKINEYKSENTKYEFSVELTKLGIMSKYHNSIITTFKTMESVKNSIYDLYLKIKIPFKTCDEIALKLGYEKTDKSRIKAFIVMHYKKINNSGILYETDDKIKQVCRDHNMPFELVLSKLVHVEIDEIDYYISEKLYVKEKFIEEICDILIKKLPPPMDFDEKEYVKNKILDSTQALAAKNAINNSISIITGAPGTGKSYLISLLVKELHINNILYVMAPTGAAVERLRKEDFGQCNTKTVTLQSFVFQHKQKNKNKNRQKDYENKENENYKNKENENYQTVFDLYKHYDEFIFFIDEMSMVDMCLFYDFMNIIFEIKDKVRVILLGDKNQLPSIKGGYILNDLINSNTIKTTFLNHSHRTKNKEIITNADLVLEGSDLIFNKHNMLFVEAETINQTEKILIDVIKNNKIKYENSCILIPTRRNGICVNAFNPILQNYYNPLVVVLGNKFPAQPAFQDKVANNNIFRVNDKIMQGKNNKEKNIYNGSIMIVDKVNSDNYGKPLSMECKYYKDDCDMDKSSNDYDVIKYKANIMIAKKETDKKETNKKETNKKEADKKETDENEINKNEILEAKLDLAYAMTIHKAQGKGYDTVIIIINSSMYDGLLNKNLLYTAITRAKNKCIIIGNEEGLDKCKKGMVPRITNLYRESEKTLGTEKTLKPLKPLKPFFDEIMTIHYNLNKFNNSPSMSKLLATYDIKMSNLRKKSPCPEGQVRLGTCSQPSPHYSKELSKLYLLIMRNDLLLNELLFFNAKVHPMRDYEKNQKSTI